MKPNWGLLVLLSMIGHSLKAADWPAWRGPSGQGFCEEKGILRNYVLMRNGTTQVFAASPTYELLASNPLQGESTNSTIGISNGDIFIRTFKHLWCLDKAE